MCMMPHNAYLRRSVMVHALMHTCRTLKSLFAQSSGEYVPKLLQNCNKSLCTGKLSASDPPQPFCTAALWRDFFHCGEKWVRFHFFRMKLPEESLSCSHHEAYRCTGWICHLEKHKCSCLIFKIESQEKEKVVVLHRCAFLGILAISPVCHSSSFTICQASLINKLLKS